MKSLVTICFASLCLGPLASSLEAQTDPALAKQAYDILRNKCYKCHGLEKRSFDALNRKSMVESEASYVAPANLGSSYLWTRVGLDRDMPPKRSGIALSEEELNILKQWIETGADFPPPERTRETLDERYVLTQIDAHLGGKVARANWKDQRYFSLAHLHNNPGVTDYQMRLYRAALSKVINSLHRRPQIVLPVAVDPHQVVYNLDLRLVGWLDPTQFLQVLQEYPFGLERNDPAVNDLAENVNERLGGGNKLRNRVPYVRADWFIAKASRPPLYNTLLSLPDTEAKLQAELGVQFLQEFNNDTLLRAAFTQSGVSRRNRLVDRLVGNFGYYYRSDDFGNAAGRAVLPRFPLGPKSAFEEGKHPFENEAYIPDGGEIVFRLPNGMQGYMIVNKEGKRLEEAPVSIVRDLTEISGSPAVVNGVSCLGCHKEGVQIYQDNIRSSVILGGNAGRKVAALYRDQEIASALRQDIDTFMTSLTACIGSFLKQGEDAGKNLREFPEPIKEVVQLYDSGVSMDDAARELGVAPELLQAQLRGNPLQNLGLGPLLLKDKNGNPNKIPRDVWDSKDDNGSSVFQVVARELGLGIGINIPKNSN